MQGRGLEQLKNDEYEQSLCRSRAQSVYSQMAAADLTELFKGYKLHTREINLERLQQSPYLVIRRLKNAVYYGQVVNGQCHGAGIMVYDNGRVYEGMWESDRKHGKGYERMTNTCTYEGDYLNGKPEGRGKHAWPNGQFYEGEWVNGLKHGSGIWKGAKGDSYIGEWKCGKADGYGVHIWVNKDRYEGEFKQCFKHGEGVEKFSNGDSYQGSYLQNKPHGYGEYYWSNGSFFKGNFKQGLRHGHGVWKKNVGNADQYEGEYVQDSKEGYGIFTWAVGNVYKGHYQGDLRHGYGEMYWADGSYYKGEWRKGIQNGEGAIYVPDKGMQKGVFKDNVLMQLYEEQETEKSVKEESEPPSRVTWNSVDAKVRKVNPQQRYLNNTGVKAKPLPPSAADELKMFHWKHQTLDNSRKDKMPHSAFYIHRMNLKNSGVNVGKAQRYYSRLQNEETEKTMQEIKEFNRNKFGKKFVTKNIKRK